MNKSESLDEFVDRESSSTKSLKWIRNSIFTLSLSAYIVIQGCGGGEITNKVIPNDIKTDDIAVVDNQRNKIEYPELPNEIKNSYMLNAPTQTIDDKLTIQIGENFNYVGLGVKPSPEINSEDLFNKYSGITSIFNFDSLSQKFDFQIRLENGNIFGSDFNLEEGKGYIIKSISNFELSVPFTDAENTDYSIVKGFNSIGMKNSLPSATELLENNSNLESIFNWKGTTQSWGFVIKLDNGDTFGEDFSMNKNNAYFLKSKTNFELKNNGSSITPEITKLNISPISNINTDEGNNIQIPFIVSGGQTPYEFNLTGSLSDKFTFDNNIASWQTGPLDNTSEVILEAIILDSLGSSASKTFEVNLQKLYHLLNGNIKNMHTDVNVASANVSFNGTSTVTNADGNYSFFVIPGIGTYTISNDNFWRRDITNFNMPSEDSSFNEIIVSKDISLTHMNETARWPDYAGETPLLPDGTSPTDYENFPGVNQRWTTVPTFYIMTGTLDNDPLYEMHPLGADNIEYNLIKYISNLTNSMISLDNLVVERGRDPPKDTNNIIWYREKTGNIATVSNFSTYDKNKIISSRVSFADTATTDYTAVLRITMKALGINNDAHTFSNTSLVADPPLTDLPSNQDYAIMKWKHSRSENNKSPDKDDFSNETNYLSTP